MIEYLDLLLGTVPLHILIVLNNPLEEQNVVEVNRVYHSLGHRLLEGDNVQIDQVLDLLQQVLVALLRNLDQCLEGEGLGVESGEELGVLGANIVGADLGY